MLCINSTAKEKLQEEFKTRMQPYNSVICWKLVTMPGIQMPWRGHILSLKKTETDVWNRVCAGLSHNLRAASHCLVKTGRASWRNHHSNWALKYNKKPGRWCWKWVKIGNSRQRKPCPLANFPVPQYPHLPAIVIITWWIFPECLLCRYLLENQGPKDDWSFFHLQAGTPLPAAARDPAPCLSRIPGQCSQDTPHPQ